MSISESILKVKEVLKESVLGLSLGER